MKNLINSLKMISVIGIMVSLAAIAYAYDSDDKVDRISGNGSSVFSPGYINAAKQKTESVINQATPGKGFLEQAVEYIKDKVGDKVKDESIHTIVPELKKKTGVGGETNIIGSDLVGTNAISSGVGDIDIGSGSAQVYDNGRLISEVVGGTRRIYVGFNNAGVNTVQAALDIAADTDAVFVKEGIYNEDISMSSKGVSMYGGYDENGNRDIKHNTTYINGWVGVEYVSNPGEVPGSVNDPYLPAGPVNASVEISGFTMTNMYISYSSNIAVMDNIFSDTSAYNLDDPQYSGLGISMEGATDVTIKNNTFNTSVGVVVDGLTHGELWRLDGVSLGVSADGVESVVYSEKNNYNGNIGFYTMGKSTILSAKDKFEGSNVGSSQDYLGFGDIVDITITKGSASSSSITFRDAFNQFYYRNLNNYGNMNSAFSFGRDSESANAIMPNLFKGLLENRNEIFSKGSGQINIGLVRKIVGDAMMESGLPAGQASARDMDIALMLAKILKDPTEDQKDVLDAVTALMAEAEKIDTGNRLELTKASDELMRAVAAVLLAQAIPDLLKEGDIANVKDIFRDLGSAKSSILLEYQATTKTYYDGVVKDLIKNMNVLQLHNLLFKSMTKEELEKLSRSEIDKILDKLKNMEMRSFEEEYILQQEAKYRKTYLDPGKKRLEEGMRSMMEDFTKRINVALENTVVNTARGAKKK